MRKKIRIGVIGCGAIAQRLHIPDFAHCPEAELSAFCDLKHDRADVMAAAFAPGAAVYTDWKKLVKDAQVDAVSVCLPNALHGPVSIGAAQAGKHVLVEKPMATSAAEAQKMIDAAKKAKVVLMVNQCQRLFPAHRKAKEVLDSGILGKVLHVSAMFGHSGPEAWSPTGKWFFKKKDARFGAMADLGVHKADLIRFLTGKEIVEVSAFVERLEKKNSDVDDNLASCIKFADGTIGMLGASWTAKGGGADYTYLHCANGTLRVKVESDRPLVAELVNPESTIVFDMPAARNDYAGSWGLDAGGGFVRAILGKEAPFCTGEEGKKSLEVILAAEKAAQTGRSVRLGKGKK